MKKEREKILKQEKAITLVALMITIIVLLILAGVTLSLTLGERGIFRIAKDAGKNWMNAQAEEEKALSEFDKEIDKILGNRQNKWGENVKACTDRDGNIIPVPVGFEPILDSEGQGTKDTGFVIRDTSTTTNEAGETVPSDTNGNEFVWIPVEGMSYTYNRYAFTRTDWDNKQTEKGTDEGTNSEKIEVTYHSGTFYYTEAMPQDEKTSVETYGGYYIGRYEAGISKGSARTANNIWQTAEQIEAVSGKAITQENKDTYNCITRNQAKELAERVYPGKSKLISSYGWDTALKFIEKQNSTYPTNSVGGTGKLQKTGYEENPPCNIYDMGGNVSEWTTESYSNISMPWTLRGGSFFAERRPGFEPYLL